MRFPFCGASYTSQSPFVAHERTLNFYPELVEAQAAANSIVLYPTPGFAPFLSLPTYPVRGMLYLNNRLFVVSGATFYELFENQTYVSRGTVYSDGQPATLSSNGDAGHQVWITSGGHGYIYDTVSGTFTSDVRLDAWMGAFCDGYFLRLDTQTSTLGISSLEDGLTWDETDVAQRSTTPDRWVSMLVSHQQVWMFGKQRIDVLYNSGDTFPFVPYPGTLIEHGIAAPFSAKILDNTVFWLGQNDQGGAVVYRAQGYTPTIISTRAVEFAMQGYARVDDAVAFAYQDQGHSFYVLSFPTANATWVYDAATNLWHERGHWNYVTDDWDVWQARFHAYAWNQHIVGDGTTGGLYRMRIDRYRDADGTVIRRMRQAPHIIGQHQNMFYSRAELLLETGIGSSDVRNPRVGLQWSDDSGKSWSTLLYVSAGMAGQYSTRAIWRRLGQSRDRIFRVVVSDGVPWRLIDLLVDVEPGMH